MESEPPTAPAPLPEDPPPLENNGTVIETGEASQDAPPAEVAPPLAPASAPEPPQAPPSNGISETKPSPKCEPQIDTQNLVEGEKHPTEDAPMKVESKLEEKEAPEASSGDVTAPVSESNELETEEPEEDSVPKDPYEGTVVEQLKVQPSGLTGPMVGLVKGLKEADGRIPPRYSIQWTTTTAPADTEDTSSSPVVQQDEWLPTELNADVPPTGNLQFALEQIKQRYETHVEQALDANPMLPQLLLYAAIEEALQTNLQQVALQEDGEGAAEDTGAKLGSKKNPHPPLYYTANPSSYMQPPSATDTTSSSKSTGTQVVMTPASLGQRVRAGCQWATRYVASHMPPPPVAVTAPVHQRRSLRQPKPAVATEPIPKPTPVQTGGRVAMWLIEQIENEIAKEKEEGIADETEEGAPEDEPVQETAEGNASMEEDIPLAEEPAKTSENLEPKEKDESPTEEVMDINDVLSEEEESKPDEDDDDYGSKDALDEAEDDEELDNVEREGKDTLRMSPFPEEPADDEDGDGPNDGEEEEETEEDIENAIMFDNPYLQPNLASMIEHLSRPKSLSAEDIQSSFMDIVMRIKFSKRSSNFSLDTDALEPVDQVVLDQEAPDYPPGKVVLKAICEETFGELQKLEVGSFSRAKFVLDVIGDEEAAIQTQRKQELILQEIEFKEKKAWAKWRYKGIHEGYATWPTWQHAIASWVEENVAAIPNELEASPTETAPDDEALAKSLEEADDTTGRRRTVRRAAAAASDGVYYGNQSGLTQKQLQDAMIRLIKTNKFQTLLRIQAMVGDDSSDPLKRCRIALGKLLCKRNLLARKAMDADLSDAKILESITAAPLLSLPPPENEDDTLETDAMVSQPVVPTLDEKALIDYIQHLHATELRLRRLVAKNLAEIPVAIVATAADERPNSMESMDSADFEEPAGIEWLTTGHHFLMKTIFRPSVCGGNFNDLTACFWYQIQDYSKSIQSEAEDKEEPDAKQRRMRFRAIPIPPPGEESADQEGTLLLTEAQVQAGIKAAEIEKRNLASTTSDGNPFSGAAGDKVTLIPVDGEDESMATEFHGRIVGYDNVVQEDGDIEYRILFLPDSPEDDPKESFWASLDVRADTSSYVCQPLGGSNLWYSIEQFDYHNGSAAYQQCESVLIWLSRQGKAGPFAEPVDPVALNIPSYPLVVKNPMDLSTVNKKLENGQYSRILPGETRGVSAISKMLNGPFRKDLELIFDNAMLFNPPDDWIYKAASQLKKGLVKKISDLSQAADQKVSGGGRFRQKKSVYVDDGSDIDMYEYESDNDEDFDGGGRKRKRSVRGGGQKDEFAARAIEHPIRLQTTLREATDLRGPFANLPINLSASSYSLPPRWSCRLSTVKVDIEDEAAPAKKGAKEMAELLELQKIVQANESASLRRSTRSYEMPNSGSRSKKNQGSPLEYFMKGMAGRDSMKKLPTSRLDVEIQAELLHEDYYSKLFQSIGKNLVTQSGLGAYSNGYFPPYLGRVIPISGWDEVSWEIRAPFVVPALRWVLRGLIQSGHLTAVENLAADFSSGVIMTNDIYHWDASLTPFEVLDLRELQRKKRANREYSEESEDEVEMSEYEKARAERVARNAERLKALGLG